MASFKFVALVVALLIASFVIYTRADGRCGFRERFHNCGRPLSCQPSCAHPEGRLCASSCAPRCVCDELHVRNARGQCVHRRECGRRFL